MTFELSSQHTAARDHARALAESLQAQAAEADQSGRVSAAAHRDVMALLSPDDQLTMVVVLEEIATALPAAAVSAIGNAAGSPLTLSGLHGGHALEDSPRAHLGLAAVALGIGRAALEGALGEIRQVQGARTTEGEKPQWVVADVATDLDAARLLTYKAAESNADADIAVARLMASAAAGRAVDAALRIMGASALGAGHPIERLSRDVRAVSLLLGTEERQRTVAADALLPQ